MSRGGEPIRLTKKLSGLLKYYRFQNGLYTREMARQVGLSKTTYHDIETGHRKYLSADSFQRITNWLTH